MARSLTGTPEKPKKPYPDFPLYAHARGQWAKTIRGKAYYFGPWSDWKAALDRYQRERDDLYAGRKPRPASEGHTVEDCCNRFLEDKEALVASGELTQRAWDDYLASCKRIVAQFGKQRVIDDLRPEDFAELRTALAQTRSPGTLANEIGRIRTVMRYVGPDGIGWLDRPVRMGAVFRKPSRKTLRLHRAAQPTKELPAEVIRAAIAKASPQLAAMIYLGINCGMGNRDVAVLEPRHLDLDTAWLVYPRPKTGIDRLAKLWPETVAAIRTARESIDQGDAATVFVTKYGNPWIGQSRSNPVSAEFRKALIAAKVYAPGRAFYSLRSTFQTIAEGCGDFPAISLVMGHDDGSMASRYRQRISPDRIERVAETVRTWLLG